MTILSFQEREVGVFINGCADEKILENNILTPFKYDATADNLQSCSDTRSCKLKIYMEDNSISCEKC